MITADEHGLLDHVNTPLNVHLATFLHNFLALFTLPQIICNRFQIEGKYINFNKLNK